MVEKWWRIEYGYAKCMFFLMGLAFVLAGVLNYVVVAT